MKVVELFKRNLPPVKRGLNSAFLCGSCSVPGVMLHVMAALLPIIIWGVYLFGFRVLTVAAVSVAACVVSEALLTLLLYKKAKISDLTAVVTGLMLAMTLPAATPLWIPAVGGVIAIAVKQLSGGTGRNFLNPALFARTVIMLIFGRMMIYTAPFVKLPLFANVSDGLSAGTAMGMLNDGRFPTESVYELLSGKCAGNIGEISSILILLGGIFLLLRGIISYRIPVAFSLTVMALTYLFPRIDVDSSYAVYSILSGGVLFAAFFMATDHSTSPCMPLAQFAYGIGCGALTVLFRYSGLFYDGAYPAVLIMNELSRPLDLLFYRLFGPKKTAAKPKKAPVAVPADGVTETHAPGADNAADDTAVFEAVRGADTKTGETPEETERDADTAETAVFEAVREEEASETPPEEDADEKAEEKHVDAVPEILPDEPDGENEPENDLMIKEEPDNG